MSALELEAVRNDGLSLVQIARNLQLTRWMNGQLLPGNRQEKGL